jgi:hypothetical protein
MADYGSWKAYKEKLAKGLEKRTGEGLAAWNARVAKQKPKSEAALRTWLGAQGIEGYTRDLLVMEHFGYPDFLTASAAELVDAQYKTRPQLRPVYDKIVKAMEKLDASVQARKTYVSIVSPRRTFARVQASKDRVHVALRLEGRKPSGRLKPSKIHDTMPLEITFAAASEVDAEAVALFRDAWKENA